MKLLAAIQTKIVLAAAILWPTMLPAQAEADHGAIAQAALADVIRPGFAALATSAGALHEKVEALCAKPSPDSLKEARGALATAVGAWSMARSSASAR
jgi:predicted lipoprotein